MNTDPFNILLGMSLDEASFQTAQQRLTVFQDQQIRSADLLARVRQQVAQTSGAEALNIEKTFASQQQSLAKQQSDMEEAALLRQRQQRSQNAQEILRIERAASEERMRIAERTQQAEQRSARQGSGWSFLGGQSFRQIGFQLRSIPGGGIPETLGRLSPLADVAAGIATGTSAGGAPLLALTGGLVALGAVLTVTTNRVNAVAEAEKELIKIRQDAERFALENTRESVQERVKELQDQLQREKQILDSARQARDEFASSIASGVTGASMEAYSIGARLGIAPGSDELAQYRSVNEAYEKQGEVVRDLAEEQLNLNRALLEGKTRTADYREAVERGAQIEAMTTEERQNAINANNVLVASLGAYAAANAENNEIVTEARRQIDLLLDDNALLSNAFSDVGDRAAAAAQQIVDFRQNIGWQIQVQGMDAEQRQDRIFEIQREMATWKEFSEGLAYNDERAKAARDALADLRHELGVLTTQASTNADVLKYVNGSFDNLNDSTDAYFDNLTRSLETAEKASKDWEQAQQEIAARLKELEAERLRKIGEAEADAAKDQLKLEEDTQEKRAEQEKDHQDRILKLIKDAEKDIRTAIGERDALALFLRREKLAEDIAEEKAKNDEQLKRIEDAYDEQTEAIQERLDEQLRKIKEAHDRAVEEQRQRYAAEERVYQQAMMQREVDLFNHNRQLDAIQSSSHQVSIFRTNDFYKTMDGIQEVYLNSMAFRWGAFMSQMAGAMGGVIGDKGKVGKTGTLSTMRGQNLIRETVYSTIAEMGAKARAGRPF